MAKRNGAAAAATATRTVQFLLGNPDEKKHSRRFNFVGLESFEGFEKGALADFAPQFYIPKPVAEKASRVRVTIEVLD